MLKQIFDAGKSLALTYRRLVQCEEEIKKLQEADREKETRLRRSAEVEQGIVYEIDRDRQLAERDKKTAESERENLILRLENALLKNEQRFLSLASAPQADPMEWKAELAALRGEVEELKKRVAALENL